MIKILFFDLDGTIMDQQTAQTNAAKDFFLQYGFDRFTREGEFVDAWKQATSFHYGMYLNRQCSFEEQRIRRVKDVFSRYGVTIDSDKAAAVYADYSELFKKNWVAYEDASKCVLQLRAHGIRMGVITNGDPLQQTQKLEKTGLLDCFEDVVAGNGFGLTKKSPALFLIACRRSGVEPNEFIYVGDTYQDDIETCLSLNAPCFLVSRNGSACPDPRVQTVSSCTGLPDRIMEMMAYF